MVNKLNKKQLQAAKEYLVDLNQTKALERAGYSKKTAKQQACRLFTNVYFQEEIQRLMAERSKRTEITIDRVLQELAKIAFFDPRGLFNDNGTMKQPSEWSDEVAAVIGGLDVNTIIGNDDLKAVVQKMKLIDKKGALELIGRHLAMFRDNLNLNQSNAPYNEWLNKTKDAK